MELGYSGKAAIVTGGSQGIGLSVARGLAQEGCDVGIVGRDKKALAEAASSIVEATGRVVVPLVGDMGHPDDVSRCINRGADILGRLDILVTGAGGAPMGGVGEVDYELWDQAVATKLFGYARAVECVVPIMSRGGSGGIVFIAGNGAAKPRYWEIAASTINAAVVNMALALAEELGQYNIRVNCVSPGPTETRRWSTAEDSLARHRGVDRDAAHQIAMQSIPLGRIGKVEEVAALVVFLASPAAGFVSGAHVLVDGAQRTAIMAG